MGRKMKVVDQDKFIEAITLYFSGGHPKQECADILGVTHQTFDRMGTMLWENGYKLEGLPFLEKDREARLKKEKLDKRNARRRENYRRDHPKKDKNGEQRPD